MEVYAHRRKYWQEIGAVLTVTDRDARSAYLDEIRRKLTRYGMPEQMPERWPLRRRLYLKTVNTLSPLLTRGVFGSRKRELGLDWPADAETMIGMRRLTSLQECVETVLNDDVPGDLVE